MVCSITNSNINKNIIYIGTKDGKVKTIDIERGQSIQSINCCNNAVIELSLVENVGTRHPFILAWPCKERCIKIVNPQNGKITTAPSKGYLEFSCGVGPKASQFNGNNCLCVLSQG